MPSTPTWVLIVNWLEPEVGGAAYGPYESEAAAYAAWPAASLDFVDIEGILPDDVEYHAVRMQLAL